MNTSIKTYETALKNKLGFPSKTSKTVIKTSIQTKYGFAPELKLFANGNSKLPKNHLIINMTTATSCPAEKFCQLVKVCYAKKCERIYTSYLNKNLSLESFFKNTTAAAVIELVELYLLLAPATAKIKKVRLNEAGDFISQYHVDMFDYIAGYLNKNYGIETYCYTCRIDLDFSATRHLIINASRPEVNKYNRIFRGMPKDEFKALPKKAVKCKGDCKICSICSTSGFSGVVYCKEH